MSERPRSDGLVLGGPPRVNLLPPEVHEGVRARKLRRTLGVLVVLALIVAAVGYAAAVIATVGQEASLAAANSRTAQIVSQTTKYAAAKVVAQEVKDVQNAQVTATATEVLWPQMAQSIDAIMPQGVEVFSLQVSVLSGGAAVLPPAGQIAVPGVVGTMDITLHSPSINAAALAYSKLPGLKGYAGAQLKSITADSGAFTVEITVEINDDAFAHRFGPTATGASN